MFGTNPVRKQEPAPVNPTPLWVQEVFYTVQGEGPFSGHPSVFIRLGGCNLKCHFCDADFESSKWTPDLTELLKIVRHLSYGGKVSRTTEGRVLIDEVTPKTQKTELVVITGGEPFRQPIHFLIDALNKYGYRTQIETSGTLWYKELEPLFQMRTPAHRCKNSIVCSPKTPRLNSGVVPYISCYKYIVKPGGVDELDGLPNEGTQLRDASVRIARPWEVDPDFNELQQSVYVQPCCEYTGEPKFINLTGSNIPVHYNENKNIPNMKFAAAIALKHGYRLSTQVHKMVGVP